MKKTITIILVLGIILRLFLALGTYHPDITALGFAGKIISQGNILNLYDYLSQLPADSSYLKVYPPDLFIYPPPIYFLYGTFISLTGWLVDPQVFNSFVINFPSTLGNIQLNVLLLLLKLPYFAFDIAIAYILMSFVKEDRYKRWIFGLWIFNPINLYATYIMGQFDVIPTFFVVAALYLALKKERIYWAAVLLGVGMSFKIYPLLFMVPLALVKTKWIDRIKVFLVGLTPYIIFVLPFIFSRGFRTSALVAGQTTKSFYATLPISGGESIILYLAAVIFMFIVFLYSNNGLEYLSHKFFVLLLLFFVFTHYHPQWFVWVTPFLILDLVKSKLKNWPIIVLLFVSWAGLITFFDPGLTVRLFAPLSPMLWTLPGIWQLVGVNIDINMARSVLQTVFVGVAIYYIYNYFPKKSENA